MYRARVKICGVSRVGDARLVSEAGADAVGMIFHPPSRRNISIERGQEIVRALGPFVTPVGVFVDAATQTIADVAKALGLRVVQLHGNESAEQVIELGKLGLRVIKALRVDASLERELERWRQEMPQVGASLAGIVLETGNIAQAGGAGVPNDFHAIHRHQQMGHFTGLPPMIVAGGLSPETVQEVVRTLRPWGVDVSSGVESSPGVKSPEKIEAFVRAARKGAE
ncbi:MAG TPA: phosphoribosylanthranilate isomerase [Tepidisphaeraceae bacterium]|nr:phosphoribosylanthranilate isomerase [Tepidisphaeraceae bacterium]